jgi:hypothetical protein
MIFIKDLNRKNLVIDSVTQGLDVGQFGGSKNNLLAGAMAALMLRHCVHLACVPAIEFSKQVGASQLLSALDNLKEELATNPDKALVVHTENTLNYFLMFITNGYLATCTHVIQ